MQRARPISIRTTTCLILLGWGQAIAAERDAVVKDQWIAITAPALKPVIAPLCEHRRREGLHVVVIDASTLAGANESREQWAEAMRDTVQQRCRAWKGRSYVLIAGAIAEEVGPADGCRLPALAGTVSRMTGQPTDNGYGCLDDTLMPTVAVGRFPARTPEEARDMVAKTLAWEADLRPGRWKRDLTLLAGAPSFNPAVDQMVEKLALSGFDRLDPGWSVRAIYRNPNSPFCLPDNDLRDRATAYLEARQALTVYLGHSGADGFWYRWSMIDDQMGWVPLFGRDEWSQIEIKRVAGVFATFGCHGTQLSGEEGEGYGVYAMRNRHGPVAVIGSHGACDAAMSLLFSEGLLRKLPALSDNPRLGEVWLAIKEHLATGWINPLVYYVLDRVDGDPDTPQAVRRREHLEMFLLLGDPAIRFPSLPAKMTLRIEGAASPEAVLQVTGRVPEELVGATGRLTLERPITSTPNTLQPVPSNTDNAAYDRVLKANHEASNRFDLVEADVRVEGREFAAELELPPTLPWPKLIVRVYLATTRSEGMAVRIVSSESQPP